MPFYISTGGWTEKSWNNRAISVISLSNYCIVFHERFCSISLRHFIKIFSSDNTYKNTSRFSYLLKYEKKPNAYLQIIWGLFTDRRDKV